MRFIIALSIISLQSFLHQILSGVAYLHAQGSLHLDLNPDNLLIDLSGKILKVAALGMATNRGVDFLR